MRYETMDALAVGLALQIMVTYESAGESLEERAKALLDLHERVIAILFRENVRRYASTEVTREPAKSEPA